MRGLGAGASGAVRPEPRLPVRSGTVVLVADRSLSMPPESEGAGKGGRRHRSFGDALRRQARRGVVRRNGGGGAVAAVGQVRRLLRRSGPRGVPTWPTRSTWPLSLIGREEPGRILVLSDGQWTGRDVAPAAARAAAAGVAVDYRAIERSAAGDLAIERIAGPESVLPGESFMITAWLDSPLGQPVSYELLRGAQVIARGHAGRSRGHEPVDLSATRPASAASASMCFASRGKGRTPCRRTTAPGCWWACAATAGPVRQPDRNFGPPRPAWPRAG